MTDVKICVCGIAADDCEYHKPEHKTIRVEYEQQADGTWTMSADSALGTGKFVLTGLKFDPGDNPFFTNDMTKRAEYMRDNPDTWPSAVRDAGLLAPWELQKK